MLEFDPDFLPMVYLLLLVFGATATVFYSLHYWWEDLLHQVVVLLFRQLR